MIAIAIMPATVSVSTLSLCSPIPMFSASRSRNGLTMLIPAVNTIRISTAVRRTR